MYRIIENENPYINSKDEMIIPSAKNGADKAIELIDKINVYELHKNLNLNGYNISLNVTKEKVKKIKEALIKIKNFDEKDYSISRSILKDILL